jgi:U3 small nucleolar RNA-associated protein 14
MISTITQIKEAEFRFAENLRAAGAPEDMVERFLTATRARIQEEADRREEHLQGVAAWGMAGTETATRAWYPHPQKVEALANMAKPRIPLGAAA